MSDEKTIRDIATLKANYVNMASDVAETKQAVNEIPERLQKLFDERYAKQADVRDIQDVIEPLVTLRKRMWYLIVASVIGVSMVILLYTNKIPGLF